MLTTSGSPSETDCRALPEVSRRIRGPHSRNEIVIGRTQNVGKLSAELAISAGITGPMLRACGVNYDIRKVDGYGFYPRFKFRIPARGARRYIRFA